MTPESSPAGNTRCKICGGTTAEHAVTKVRVRHIARILRCTSCGFLSVENPRWLAEAYAEPINRSDTGYVRRNLVCRDRVCTLIEASELDLNGTFLDYAAGYGMFVRLMRDSGYDFRWFDPYCQNLFSSGFEAENPLSRQFEAVTAFEVLEHLQNPMEEIAKIASMTHAFIFSTQIVPEPAPQPHDWWYYGLDHGQHIAFYTVKSLEVMAEKTGCRLVTNGSDFHVLARKNVSLAPALVKRTLFQRIWGGGPSARRPMRDSLTEKDREAIVRQTLEHN